MFFLLKRVYHKVNDLSRGKWRKFWKIFKLCEDIFMMNRGENFFEN